MSTPETGEPVFDDDDFAEFTDSVRRWGLEPAHARWARRLDEGQAGALRAEYDRRTTLAVEGFPPKIFSLPGRQGWYAGPLEGDQFWPAVRGYLEQHRSLPQDQIELLDQASTKIIAHTADPRLAHSDSRGLVVGHVQSGKTTNFTAVIAKAIDVGYNLVIVLSGIHNGLRRQTQERLQVQLGAGHGGRLVEMTTLDHDFSTPPHTLESVLPPDNERGAILCIVKKNAAPLGKLVRWLETAQHTGTLGRVKALVIDDEADQASVATPKINPLIRKVLGVLPRKTFIGYTATPFANVLIGTDDADDLYPKDFILSLPEPEQYFGPRMIFGRDELPGRHEDGPVDGLDMVRQVPADDAGALRPPRSGSFNPMLPDSLVDAVLWFWLATAAKRARGLSDHSTMLVHTTMRIGVHDALADPLNELRRDVLRQIRGGGSEVTWVRVDGTTASRDLVEFWKQENDRLWNDRPTRRYLRDEYDLTRTDFDKVREQLEDAVEDTKVVLEHSRSLERLSYANGTVTAIAVGGNTLSRGLTLEGLVVSYFIRAANAYDTLMQMGRWFGFRTGYEDLPRIYMTDELKDWFRHLAAVEEEIRLDIASYEQQTMRPTDFGVRIRTHPKLLVTQKLGAARQAYTSYGGRRLQVRYFKHRDSEWLEGNLTAASALIEAARRTGDPKAFDTGAHLWRDVPVRDVLDFLGSYEVHEDSPDMNREMLRKYIEAEVGADSLDRWSVAVVGGEDDTLGAVTLGEYSYNRLVRSRLKDGNPDRADIKTLMSKEHRVLDLSITQAAARRSSEESLMNMRQADPVHRTRGLLILYPIDALSPPADEETLTREPLAALETVIGLALVFPGDKADAVKNSYISADVTASRPAEDDTGNVEELFTVDTESDDGASAGDT